MVTYKEPAVAWVNEANPIEDDSGLTLERANEEKTIYLVQDVVSDSPDAVREWVELNFEALFENELESWYVNDSLWPKKRTIKLFDDWFSVECHSVIIDTVDEPIVDESY